LALKLWERLELDRFWTERLAKSRKGTRWDPVLFVLLTASRFRVSPCAKYWVS
jgi:hypothetical protein